MQYQVPQFIDIEDRIVGPLTLKQFLYLAFAGAILFVLSFLLEFYIWIIIALPVAVLAFAFAFLKINDRPFVFFFLAAISYFIKPKLYVFGKMSEIVRKKELPKPESSPAENAEGTKVTRSKLKELALSLDTGAVRLNNEAQ